MLENDFAINRWPYTSIQLKENHMNTVFGEDDEQIELNHEVRLRGVFELCAVSESSGTVCNEVATYFMWFSSRRIRLTL